MRYEIIYDYSDEWADEYNLTNEFTGTHEELEDYLRQLREAGCYHFSVSCIADENGEAW